MGNEKQKYNEQPKAIGEVPSDAKPEGIMLQIRQAFEKKEGRDTLLKLGDLMYETFKDRKYSADVVLSSIRDIHNQYKDSFVPPIGINAFIRCFGPGLVKLCQLKLSEKGGYELGASGISKNGVDGKLGRKTRKAISNYYGAEPKVQPQKETKVKDPVVEQPTPGGKYPRVIDIDSPEEMGKEKPIISPQGKIQPQVEEGYKRYRTTYTHKNLKEQFGYSEAEAKRFIIYEDPLTHKPISFLDQSIDRVGKSGKGINPILYVLLKIGEDKIWQKIGRSYKPRTKIGGFAYRNMQFNNKDSGLKSHHSYGLAIDLDPGENGPKNGRGDIPDQVISILVNECGLAWGGVKGPGFSYLGKDPMHFQCRFGPKDPAFMEIINSSKVGQEYWAVLKPMLDKMKGSSAT
jgi:hypothetical protein